MALAHPSDERRSAPPSLARRHALRAPQTASGGPRRRTPPHARRTVPQTLTTSGKTRLRYDRARRRAQKPQSTTVQEVVVHARPCGFFCHAGRIVEAIGIVLIGGGPEDPVADAAATVEAATGDLSLAEIAQIQRVVNRAGRPLEVVGSAARGARTAGSDIDYVVPPSSLPYYDGLEGELPGIDPEHGIIPGTGNPNMGPVIRFEPNGP